MLDIDVRELRFSLLVVYVKVCVHIIIHNFSNHLLNVSIAVALTTLMGGNVINMYNPVEIISLGVISLLWIQ